MSGSTVFPCNTFGVGCFFVVAAATWLIAPLCGGTVFQRLCTLILAWSSRPLQWALCTFLLPFHSLRAVFPWRVLWTYSLGPDGSLALSEEGGGFEKQHFCKIGVACRPVSCGRDWGGKVCSVRVTAKSGTTTGITSDDVEVSRGQTRIQAVSS